MRRERSVWLYRLCSIASLCADNQYFFKIVNNTFKNTFLKIILETKRVLHVFVYVTLFKKKPTYNESVSLLTKKSNSLCLISKNQTNRAQHIFYYINPRIFLTLVGIYILIYVFLNIQFCVFTFFIQYFSIFIFLKIIKVKQPSSVCIIKSGVELNTLRISLQKWVWTRSTSFPVWKPHTSAP